MIDSYDYGGSPHVGLSMDGWSQAELASAAGMTQSAVARFEAGGTVPTLPVLGRIARALDADLTVRVAPRPHVA
jgi:transcriptional regulator with XRE-family HTH domain